MKGVLFYIICALALVASCDKVSEAPENLLRPTLMRSYDDPGVQALTDATAGDGVVLLTYITNQGTYNFKLIDNDGNELWTVASNLPYMWQSNSAFVHKVLFEDDGLITVLYHRSRVRYNMDGEEVSREENRFAFPWNNFVTRNVIQGQNGEYIYIGYYTVSGLNTRASVVGYDRDGNVLFSDFYSALPGTYAYTGGQTLDDGSYLLAGSYSALTEGHSESYFVTRINPSGEVLWTVTHPATDTLSSVLEQTEIAGRNMIRTADGNYMFFIEGFSKSQQRIVRFDDAGEEIAPQRTINFEGPGYTYANSAYKGAALAQHEDGSLYFIGNEWNQENRPILGTNVLIVQGVFQSPSYGSFFRLDTESDVWKRAYFNRNYNNWLTGAIRLNNGKIMLAGTILSLGTDLKIIVAVQ